jgi:hypothetical protein
MSLTDTQELAVTKATADKVATVAAAGYVLPAPLYFNSRAEFWATVDGVAVNTQKLIDRTIVKACWIYLLDFTDSPVYGGEDEPMIELLYEFYLFHQYDYTRADESLTPDAFNQQLLASHNEFKSALLGIRSAFLGRKNIAALDPAVFTTKETTSVVQKQFIQNRVPCEFIPDVAGHVTRLQEKVRVELVQC